MNQRAVFTLLKKMTGHRNIGLCLAIAVTVLGCQNLKYAGAPGSNAKQNPSARSPELQEIMVEKLAASSPANYLDFIRRHSSPDLALDAEDRSLLKEIKNPQAGSTAEAVLGIGVLKDAIHNPEGEDLESISKDQNFDFATAFEMNPILSSHYFSAMTKIATEKSGQSSQFYNSLRDTLERRANAWSKINDSSSSTEWNEEPGGLQQDQSGWYGSNNVDTIAENKAPYVAKPGENVLQSAIRDQNNGRFAAAVHKLTSITATSPDYPRAQALKKSIENDRVAHLRKLAADAYRNALPLSNPGTKYAYLNEAKNHLQSALSQYPHSDLKATLEDNLGLIQGEMDTLKSEVRESSVQKTEDGRTAIRSDGRDLYNANEKNKDVPEMHQW